MNTDDNMLEINMAIVLYDFDWGRHFRGDSACSVFPRYEICDTIKKQKNKENVEYA